MKQIIQLSSYTSSIPYTAINCFQPYNPSKIYFNERSLEGFYNKLFVSYFLALKNLTNKTLFSNFEVLADSSTQQGDSSLKQREMKTKLYGY